MRTWRGARPGLVGTLVVLLLAFLPGCRESEASLPAPATTGTSAAPDTPTSRPRPSDPGGCGPAPVAAAGFAPGGWWPFADPAEQDADLDAMAAAGSRWLRLGINWSSVEPRPGVQRWDRYDRLVEAARSRCIAVIGLVLFAPEWARDPRCAGDRACRPADAAEYGRFAGDVAARYGDRLGAIELWNEPNIATFFRPEPDARAYADMLGAAVRQVRRAAPETTILSAGLAPVSSTGGTRVDPVDFISVLLEEGALDDVDGVGFHPYAFPDPPSQSTGRSGFADLMPQVRALLDGADLGTTPIWITEFGVPTGATEFSVSERAQAEQLREAFAMWRGLDRTGPLIWYAFRDAGTDLRDAEQNFGLLRQDGEPKAALAAFRREARR